MKPALAALAVALSLLITGSPARASCVAPNAADQLARADVVAYGTLVSIRMTVAPASPVVTFRPERVFKGALDGDVEVFFGPTHGGAVTSVDYAGAPPQTHTLYLRRVDGGYETTACDGSHEGAPTAQEAAALGAGAAVGTAAQPSPLAPLVVAGLGGAAILVLLRVRRRTP